MFIKNNQTFVCIHCEQFVSIHSTSSRDHCPWCLFSLHVDISPGDRQNPCKGVLEPIGIDMRNGLTKIVYRCESCHQTLFNVTAPDDDKDTLHILSLHQW